jgi:hypothetical protein
MNKLATLTVVIMLLVLVLIGACSHIVDLHHENMQQRVEIYKYCFERYGKSCTF